MRTKLKILITFALDAEFALWRGLRSFMTITICEAPTYESKAGVTELRVTLTGVGFANARKAIIAALDWKPDIFISSGLAGSLHDALGVGEVVAAREVVELETGRRIGADKNLLQAAESERARVIGRLLTSAEMVLSAEGKRRLGKIGEAVEMESFAAMSEADRAGVPAIAVRAISDAADEDLPMDFGKVLDESGNVSAAKIATELARAPHKVPAMVRLAKNSRAAAKELANFLERYVTQFGATFGRSAEMTGTRRA